MIVPLKNYTITYVFGANQKWRKYPHTGTDLISSDRTIYAPEAGVVSTGYANDAGNILYLTSTGGRRHQMYHLASYKRKSGRVAQGEPIGVFGATGQVTGAHLHWTLKVNGKLVDPMKYVNNKVEEQEVKILATNEWFGIINKLMNQVRGRGITGDEFKSFVGQDYYVISRAISDHPDADKATNWQVLGQLADKDDWRTQIVNGLEAIGRQKTTIENQAIENQRLSKIISDNDIEDAEQEKIKNGFVSALLELFNKFTGKK